MCGKADLIEALCGRYIRESKTMINLKLSKHPKHERKEKKLHFRNRMRAAMGTAACACALVLVGTTTAWALSGAGMPLGGTGVMPSATQMSDPEGGC